MLLVQLDGRIIYDPQFSGVYWEMQDVVLEDIERIEVIRGPGATLWGANAEHEGAMEPTMRAAVCRGYDGPEKVVIEDRPLPVPKTGEVLIRVLASRVSTGDARIRGMNLVDHKILFEE